MSQLSDNRTAQRNSKCPSDLQRDSKTFVYELRTLVEIAQIHETEIHIPDELTKTMNNALTEAFAIHCRAIIYFLFAHRSSLRSTDNVEHSFGKLFESDVIASDFSPSWPSNSANQTVSNALVECIRRSNKEVAHITTERRELNLPDGKLASQWDISLLTNEIAGHVNVFLNDVSPLKFDEQALEETRKIVADRLRLKSTGHGRQNAWMTGKTSNH